MRIKPVRSHTHTHTHTLVWVCSCALEEQPRYLVS